MDFKQRRKNMHSRIFGLAREFKKDVYCHNEDDVYEAMGYNADYVVEIEKKDYFDNWQWLGNVFGGVLELEREITDTATKYYVVAKMEKLHNFFVEDLQQLKDLVNNLSLTNYTTFYDTKLYDVEQKLRPTTGFWVIDTNSEYLDIITFKDWLKFAYRFLVENSIDSIRYEITEIFSYHH